jgi:hypothetical protein
MTIEKIMKEHLISSNQEAESAIEFVRDLLEREIEETEKNEPYATKSIEEMKVAVKQVSNLLDMFY